jgi:hypothetical protein
MQLANLGCVTLCACHISLPGKHHMYTAEHTEDVQSGSYCTAGTAEGCGGKT